MCIYGVCLSISTYLSSSTTDFIDFHKIDPFNFPIITLYNLSTPKNLLMYLELDEYTKQQWCSDLNEEQTQVFAHYFNGNNVFMTGAGGCGKTYLIRRIYKHASTTGKILQVCATTGCAAILLDCNAKTIHSWSGIGLGNGEVEYYVSRIKTNREKSRAWLSTHTLIIDELSMLSKRLLDLLDQIGRQIRNRNVPFGGIQVIASGDFYQLPPVSKVKNSDESAFAFESTNWTKIFPVEIELTNNHRQTDPTFLKILNEIRVGRITRSSVDLLNSYVGRIPETTEYIPARLLPTRAKVNKINQEHLYKLEGEMMVFEAIEKTTPIPKQNASGKISKPPSLTAIRQEIEFLLKNGMFEKTLELKQHAQVMCITNLNMEKGIVNGSIGRILEFSTEEDFVSNYKPPVIASVLLENLKPCSEMYPVVEFMNGEIELMKPHVWLCDKFADHGIGIAQIPLILAWAISIHKSQGTTVDMAQVDIGRSIFECGQSYVALSRVRSLNGLYLTEFNPSKIKVHRKVREFYQAMKERQIEPSEDEDEENDDEESEDEEILPPQTLPASFDLEKFNYLHGYD